jgi:hypothetical protein
VAKHTGGAAPMQFRAVITLGDKEHHVAVQVSNPGSLIVPAVFQALQDKFMHACPEPRDLKFTRNGPVIPPYMTAAELGNEGKIVISPKPRGGMMSTLRKIAAASQAATDEADAAAAHELWQETQVRERSASKERHNGPEPPVSPPIDEDIGSPLDHLMWNDTAAEETSTCSDSPLRKMVASMQFPEEVSPAGAAPSPHTPPTRDAPDQLRQAVEDMKFDTESVRTSSTRRRVEAMKFDTASVRTSSTRRRIWQKSSPSVRDKTVVTMAAASCSSPSRHKRDREVDDMLAHLAGAQEEEAPRAKKSRAGGWARGRSQFLGSDGYLRWKCPKCSHEVAVQHRDDTSTKAFNVKRLNHKHNVHKGEWKEEKDARTTVLHKPVLEMVADRPIASIGWKCPVEGCREGYTTVTATQATSNQLRKLRQQHHAAAHPQMSRAKWNRIALNSGFHRKGRGRARRVSKSNAAITAGWHILRGHTTGHSMAHFLSTAVRDRRDWMTGTKKATFGTNIWWICRKCLKLELTAKPFLKDTCLYKQMRRNKCDAHLKRLQAALSKLQTTEVRCGDVTQEEAAAMTTTAIRSLEAFTKEAAAAPVSGPSASP